MRNFALTQSILAEAETMQYNQILQPTRLVAAGEKVVGSITNSTACQALHTLRQRTARELKRLAGEVIPDLIKTTDPEARVKEMQTPTFTRPTLMAKIRLEMIDALFRAEFCGIYPTTVLDDQLEVREGWQVVAVPNCGGRVRVVEIPLPEALRGPVEEMLRANCPCPEHQAQRAAAAARKDDKRRNQAELHKRQAGITNTPETDDPSTGLPPTTVTVNL